MSDPESDATDESAERQEREGVSPEALESLPPVEPPSAGFIVQLFLIPALIVGVVIGVYFLFGRLATGELDWRRQVDHVKSENPHVRWRGALGLAQMLDADAHAGSAGQELSRNPTVAAALSELFATTRGRSPRDEETQAQLEFLAKALGRLDAVGAVYPVLIEAVRTERDRELRKHALTAIAMIAGRAFERGTPLNEPDISSDMIAVSRNDDPLDRDQAAFILGLLATPAARVRLVELVDDANLMTRANAAIGLARGRHLEGVPVFDEVLQDGVARPGDPAAINSDAQAQEYFERTLVLTNCLKAIDLLADELDQARRARFASLLERLADATADAKLSVQARELSLRLSAKK